MSVPATSRPLTIGKVEFSRRSLTSTNALLIYLALVYFVAHMLVAGNYGYFRDELYYIEGGRHLAFGYVDFPPLIALLAAIMNVVAGDALVAIHIIPALVGACLVVVAGLIARELGGGRFAQVLAALAVLVGVVFMATGSIFSMDIMDELWWTVAAYVLIRLIKRAEPRLWLVFGLVAGIGLLTKLSILFFGVALVIGLLLTPQRRAFRGKEIWLGAAIAFALFLPYLIWEIVNGWPSWEFWHNYGGLSGTSPLDFIANQVLLANPLAIPLLLAGLYFYFRTAAGRPYRALGWAYVVLLVVFIAIGAKPYFLAPADPMLFAAGAVVFEGAARQRRWAWLKPIYVPALAVLGLLLAPLAMPILPPATFVSAYGFMTGVGNSADGQGNAGAFPQYLGDRFGWDTMTTTVAYVYDGLPASQRAQACILTENYGEASALDLLGGPDHLPPVISGHNNWYLWGPGHCSGQVIIAVGQDYTKANLGQTFGSVIQSATITCQFCQAEENDVPVFVATQPKFNVQSAWPTVKHFN